MWNILGTLHRRTDCNSTITALPNKNGLIFKTHIIINSLKINLSIISYFKQTKLTYFVSSKFDFTFNKN